MKAWTRKDLLGLQGVSREELDVILTTAASFKEISTRSVKKVPTLRGKTIVLFFFEPSTRTRASFELAAKRLSADTLSLATSSSSVVKGETLKDTIRNLEAMRVDCVVVRNRNSGAAHMLSRTVEAAVVNAGDGCHEHPTQALLDIFTIRERIPSLKGVRVSIIGDIAHSRVARSNIWGLQTLGARVTVCGPRTLLPREAEKWGVRVTTSLPEALEGAAVVNILRIQRERQNAGLFPSLREYAMRYGVTREKLRAHARKDLLILHPGPINRGVELAPDVADGPFSLVLNQVTNGVAIRMAVLYLVCHAAGDPPQEAGHARAD